MNRYTANDEGFKHYVNDELRAVVPWASRETYAADWPDAPEFVFAPEIAAPAPANVAPAPADAAPAEAVVIDQPATEEQTK